MIDIHQSHSSWTRDAKRAIKSGARYILGPVCRAVCCSPADHHRMSPTSTGSPARRALGSGSETCSRASVCALAQLIVQTPAQVQERQGHCRLGLVEAVRARDASALLTLCRNHVAYMREFRKNCKSALADEVIRADPNADCRIAGFGASHRIAAERH